MTDKQIRQYLLNDNRNDKVRITRSGTVLVRTTRERGEGGRRPFWIFAGFRSDFNQLAA